MEALLKIDFELSLAKVGNLRKAISAEIIYRKRFPPSLTRRES